MILNFFVEGHAPHAERRRSLGERGYADAALDWVNEGAIRVSELTLGDVREQLRGAWDATKGAIRYVSGDPAPRVEYPATAAPVREEHGGKRSESSRWSFAGLFSGLRGVRGGPTDAEVQAEGQTYTEGEVHADLVRVRSISRVCVGLY